MRNRDRTEYGKPSPTKVASLDETYRDLSSELSAIEAK
jgi:hypothetical protein